MRGLRRADCRIAPIAVLTDRERSLHDPVGDVTCEIEPDGERLALIVRRTDDPDRMLRELRLGIPETLAREDALRTICASRVKGLRCRVLRRASVATSIIVPSNRPVDGGASPNGRHRSPFRFNQRRRDAQARQADRDEIQKVDREVPYSLRPHNDGQQGCGADQEQERLPIDDESVEVPLAVAPRTCQRSSSDVSSQSTPPSLRPMKPPRLAAMSIVTRESALSIVLLMVLRA